jgi:hypothetical protein
MKKAMAAAKKERRRTLPAFILETAICITTPTFLFTPKLPPGSP